MAQREIWGNDQINTSMEHWRVEFRMLISIRTGGGKIVDSILVREDSLCRSRYCCCCRVESGSQNRSKFHCTPTYNTTHYMCLIDILLTSSLALVWLTGWMAECSPAVVTPLCSRPLLCYPNWMTFRRTTMRRTAGFRSNPCDAVRSDRFLECYAAEVRFARWLFRLRDNFRSLRYGCHSSVGVAIWFSGRFIFSLSVCPHGESEFGWAK